MVILLNTCFFIVVKYYSKCLAEKKLKLVDMFSKKHNFYFQLDFKNNKIFILDVKIFKIYKPHS